MTGGKLQIAYTLRYISQAEDYEVSVGRKKMIKESWIRGSPTRQG